MKRLANIGIMTLLALLIKSDITILAWFVIITWQGLKLVVE